MTPIAPLIEAFLGETLARQRGVSRHTRDSYALSFQLLFMFASERLKVSPSALTLEQLDAGLVSAFLEYLEDTRKNAPVTRNVRHQVLLPLSRIPAAGSPGADPPRPGDPIQENGYAPGSLSSARGVASRA
jgi:integrase/recombinase XerD